jgi:Domain of unknown function (DUF4124)
MMRSSVLALVLALCVAPLASRAELYKCQGPDGKTLFTSDRSQCPGASAHQPSGRLQRSAPSPAPAPAARATPTAADEAAEAQAWRAKRQNAETALQQAEARLETLHAVAGWCNRGHEVFAEDRDGLRHGVDCDEVDATEKELRRERARLEAYLAEGLEEECRRAGCLPGWLR